MTNETRPMIVCLCGSTRFFKEFARANWLETLAGKIVLTVGCFQHKDAAARETHEIEITPERKVALDALHLRKIDLADEILVLNVGGYVGESTAREIAWAIATGKRVRFLEDRGILDEGVRARIAQMEIEFRREAFSQSLVATLTVAGPSPVTSRDDRVRDARRCYDLYLRAFAAVRGGGQFDLVVSEEEEAEMGFALVLLHRRAVLAGTIDGSNDAFVANAFDTKPPYWLARTPAELWAFVSVEDDWSFARSPFADPDFEETP